MFTCEFNLPKLGSVRVRRGRRIFSATVGELGSLKVRSDRSGRRLYLATLGEWEIYGCALTLFAGLIWSTVAVLAESIITN